jgi:hypothetical protein
MNFKEKKERADGEEGTNGKGEKTTTPPHSPLFATRTPGEKLMMYDCWDKLEKAYFLVSFYGHAEEEITS